MPTSTAPTTGSRTPWGKAQYANTLAEGITVVGCAGHGGVKLSASRNRLVHPAWRSKGGWYEEDCAAAIVIVTFPDVFTPSQVASADSSARNWFPDAYTAVTGTILTEDDSSVLARRAFDERTRDLLVTSAAWGDWHDNVPADMVGVFARCAGTGVEAYFLIPAEEYRARTRTGMIIDPDKHEPWSGPSGTGPQETSKSITLDPFAGILAGHG